MSSRRLLLLASLMLLASVACAPGASTPEWVFRGETMGTRYHVRVASPGRATADGEAPEALRAEVAARVADELEAVNARMSTYLADSELSRFNASRSTEPFPVSEATREVLAGALEIAAASDGALDVTVGALVDAWGFGPGGGGPAPPDAEELERLRRHAGWQKLELSAEGTAVRKRDPELQVDLSAVAKGYAVDRVARALRERGFTDFMVEVGGEVRARGRNVDGVPWRIGIESPAGEGIQRVVSLDDRSLATSGDYRNYRVVDGRRVSHTIDPRTGRPVEHSGASVSVVADSCLEADGWATALLVMGPDRGLRRAESLGLAALFVAHSEDGLQERMTSAFEALLGSGRGAAEPRASRVAAAAVGPAPGRRATMVAGGDQR